MDWQDTEKDYGSILSLSWAERNALEKSKSDSSITAIGDCNYRTQGIQVSLENCDTATNVTLENLNMNEDEEEIDENNSNFKSLMSKDYNVCNQLGNYPMKYGFKTQDITTRQLIVQGPEILNFQGNRHSPEEISRTWKKDCRMWLWKSVRLKTRKNRMEIEISTVS